MRTALTQNMHSGPRRWLQAACAIATLCLGAAPLSRAEVTLSGVRFPDSRSVDGTVLALNGAGVRYKGPFKVYAMALYLPRHASSGDEATRMPGPKRMTLQMLREVEAEELGLLMARGLRDNVDPATGTRLASAMFRMSEVFAQHKLLRSGDVIGIDCGAAGETRIEVNGKPEPPFREPELCPSLMKIWLGHVPADWRLKELLLGNPV